jgi:hypothetical protein
MSQQNRKRQHQQSRPVKEEPQEVEDTYSNGAGISAVNLLHPTARTATQSALLLLAEMVATTSMN